MLLMIGTAVATSVGAVALARVRSHNVIKKHNQLVNRNYSHLQANQAWNAAMGRPDTRQENLRNILMQNIEMSQSRITAPPKPAFHKLEEAYKQFNVVAVARAEANMSPIRDDTREALRVCIPMIINGMRDALDPSAPINEKAVNVLMKLHLALLDLLTPNGILTQAGVKDLKASLRKANLVSQGRMDKAYIEAICPAMEYSLLEVLKTLLRGADRASFEELSKMREQLEKHVVKVDKWAEKRLSF